MQIFSLFALFFFSFLPASYDGFLSTGRNGTLQLQHSPPHSSPCCCCCRPLRNTFLFTHVRVGSAEPAPDATAANQPETTQTRPIPGSVVRVLHGEISEPVFGWIGRTGHGGGSKKGHLLKHLHTLSLQTNKLAASAAASACCTQPNWNQRYCDCTHKQT